YALPWREGEVWIEATPAGSGTLVWFHEQEVRRRIAPYHRLLYCRVGGRAFRIGVIVTFTPESEAKPAPLHLSLACANGAEVRRPRGSGGGRSGRGGLAAAPPGAVQDASEPFGRGARHLTWEKPPEVLPAWARHPLAAADGDGTRLDG